MINEGKEKYLEMVEFYTRKNVFYIPENSRWAFLIMLLDEHGYPPVPKDEVYKEIFEQAENFKRFRDE